MRKKNQSWTIVFSRFFFQVTLTFWKQNQQELLVTLDYAEWKSYISLLKSLNQSLAERRKRGEVFMGLMKYRNFFHTPQRSKFIMERYGEKAKLNIASDERRTGMRRRITFHFFDFYKVALFLKRDSFVRLKDDMLKADAKIEKILKTRKSQEVYKLL